ncbi:MAG TPA: TonB-dependent receptor, partial [Cyclobacteriaceae bacterium]|nr:TonB-dependent receptor [Cyclobacteriaceae bacterium]
KGKLVDENKSPLIGASIVLNGSQQYVLSGLDGSYVISNITPGEHTLRASYVGYNTQEKLISFKGESEVVITDFQLEPDPKVLGEIVISANAEGGSDIEARKSEKTANQVMNIVSAKTIELSPDITVANVIQRVSGISLVRNTNGDPQYAIVRGMDKRYNYTLVNGIKIPSPDNENRYVPLDIFPASLLERLEVTKSLTPGMEGDAIGGVVNMVMKKAPEQLSVKGDLQLGYNQININRDFQKFDRSVISYKDPSEKYGSLYQAQFSDFTRKNLVLQQVKPLPDILSSLSIGNRFMKNRIGVLVAGSFQNTYRGTNSVWFETQVDFNGSNLPQFNSMQVRNYSTQQVREALHARLDFLITEKHKINLYSGWYRMLNAQTRDTKETKLGATGGYDPANGNAAYSYLTRTRVTDQTIFNNTLQGTHTLLSNFIFANWSAVYSVAKNDQPDNAQFNRTSGLSNFVESPQSIDRNLPRRWDRNTDTDYTGYLNFILTPAFIAEQKGEISVGGMYRNKQRSNYYNKYNLDPKPAPQYKGADWQTYNDVKMVVLNPLGSSTDEQNYHAHENLLDYYVQFKILLAKRLQVLTGVRAEQTDQGYLLLYPKTNETPSQNQKYTDVLPSMSLKYSPNERMNIRSTYYKAICRPGFFEIVPYYNDNSFTENYASAGNPNLKRIQAHNYDLRWEYFPNALDQILIGTFYKRILDPIEYALVPYGSAGQFAIQPGNYGNANNWGIEVDFTKYVNKFGLRANYTFTNSAITTAKTMRVREVPNDPTSNIIVVNVNQTRPLQGQAKHIGNVSLLYKDMKKGINAQLSFVYTGERIESVSPFLDNDQWQKPILQLDFACEKKISQHFECFLKAQNLLNSPYKVYIKKPNSNQSVEYPYQSSKNTTLTRWDQYYQSYRVGVRYNF